MKTPTDLLAELPRQLPSDSASWAAALMQSLQTVLPKRLVAPAPHAD